MKKTEGRKSRATVPLSKHSFSNAHLSPIGQFIANNSKITLKDSNGLIEGKLSWKKMDIMLSK
jgi:hypothetical protein